MADKQRCDYADCANTSTDLKCCSVCQKVRYCSKECQKADWERHVFDCKHGKPISTVYYLARDLKRDSCQVPLHHQTVIDYGFDKAQRMSGTKGANELCLFYHTLIRRLHVPLTDVKKWQKDGRLVEGIKGKFKTLPPETKFAKGGPYEWFITHQYLFDNSAVDPLAKARQMMTHTTTILLNAWPYAGGSPRDTAAVALPQIARFSSRKHHCYFFVAIILATSVPDPDIIQRLEFGFVTEKAMNVNLGLKYEELLTRCTFDEFFKAYQSSSISALFVRHGMLDVGRHRLFQDVMSGSPTTYKSVWRLKFYIEDVGHSRPGEHTPPDRSVVADYGYGNCKNAEETKLLDDLYTQLFGKHAVDPLELHAACLKGELLEFARKYVKLAPWTAKYTRLLKNTYTGCLEQLRYVMLRLSCGDKRPDV